MTMEQICDLKKYSSIQWRSAKGRLGAGGMTTDKPAVDNFKLEVVVSLITILEVNTLPWETCLCTIKRLLNIIKLECERGEVFFKKILRFLNKMKAFWWRACGICVLGSVNPLYIHVINSPLWSFQITWLSQGKLLQFTSKHYFFSLNRLSGKSQDQ